MFINTAEDGCCQPGFKYYLNSTFFTLACLECQVGGVYTSGIKYFKLFEMVFEPRHSCCFPRTLSQVKNPPKTSGFQRYIIFHLASFSPENRMWGSRPGIYFNPATLGYPQRAPCTLLFIFPSYFLPSASPVWLSPSTWLVSAHPSPHLSTRSIWRTWVMTGCQCQLASSVLT